MSPDQIAAVILAGGLGTRIKHLLPDLPKPMAPVSDRPWLEWVTRYLVKEGVRTIVLSSGYKAEVIEQHFAGKPVAGADIRCVTENEPLGTAGGLLHAVRSSGIERPCWLALNGDTMAFADIAAGAAALEDRSLSGVVFGRAVPDASRYGTMILDHKGNLAGFQEKRPGGGVVNSGVYLLNAEVLGRFPEERPLSLERDVFPGLISTGVLLRILMMDTPFLDIGTPESLPQADGFVKANLDRFALDTL